MSQREKRVETLVGLFLFVGLILLGGLIVQFGRFGDRFREVYTITVSFEDASGVIKGSQVRLAGAKVGQVAKSPTLTEEGKVLVEMEIREDTPQIDSNAVIRITSLSLLGDKAIVITPPAPEELSGTPLQNGDRIEGGAPGGFDRIQTDAAHLASEAAHLMAKAQTTLGNVDTALGEVKVATGLLRESLESINQDLLSKDNIENFSGTLADLRGATRTVKEASLEVKPLLADAQKALQSFDRASAAAEGAFSKATAEIDKLGPALDKVPEAVDSIAQVADDASDALKSVKNKEGLVGTLAYDQEPAQDAKVFLRNLRRYGILGYRDAETYDERDPRNRYRGKRR